ncbi:unnamed protein product [Brassica oleracea]
MSLLRSFTVQARQRYNHPDTSFTANQSKKKRTQIWKPRKKKK